MAGINLTPQLDVIIGQSIVFGAAYVVTKNLMLKPYLKLRAAREEQTIGSKQSAEEMFKEIEKMKHHIKEKTDGVYQGLSELRKSLKGDALEQSQNIISSAKQKAEAELNEYSEKLTSEFRAEELKVGEIARSLSEELYNIAVEA